MQQQRFKEVATYNLIVEAAGFLCDQTTYCFCNLDNINTRYETLYDPDDAQSCITEVDSNQDLVEEVSYGILATASTDNHGYGQREMQEIASSYLESNEKVHKICKIQLMPSDKCAAPIVSEVLLQMSEFMVR